MKVSKHPRRLEFMTDHHQPTTVADCLVMLEAVLACLDAMVADQSERHGQTLSLAAIRVQDAINLIGPPDVLDS